MDFLADVCIHMRHEMKKWHNLSRLKKSKIRILGNATCGHAKEIIKYSSENAKRQVKFMFGWECFQKESFDIMPKWYMHLFHSQRSELPSMALIRWASGST